MHTLTNGKKLKPKKTNSCFCGFQYDLIADENFRTKCCGQQSRNLAYRITFATFKLLLLIFFLLFVLFPLVYKWSYSLQRSIIFLNFVNDRNPSYKNPEKYGVEGGRNFYITTDENVKLGVWQFLPEGLLNDSNNTSASYFESVLGNGMDVIIYNHGNAGSRVTDHRVGLYKVLRKYFHVIAYDYRSYGDSSDDVSPTEMGVVNDCMFMYKWVANRTNANIFIWGHSLGTSISLRSISLLQPLGYQPTGVFLESPFNNMKEEISEFPLAMMFKNLPWFSYTVIEPMQENDFKFESDKFICKVDSPIIILHAEDDDVVPFKLGKKLFERAISCRNHTQGSIRMYPFPSKHNYRHKDIYRSPELPAVIQDFVAQSIKENDEKHLIPN